MYFFFLSVFVAIACIGFFLRNRKTSLGQGLIGIGCLGCAGLVGWQIYANLYDRSEISRDRYHSVVAYAMAHEVVRDLASRKGQICLILPPESASSPEALDSLFDTFARVLRPLPDLELHEQTLPAKAKLFRKNQVPLSAFEEALSRSPNALAYVSFAGLPHEPEKLSVLNKQNGPPVFVYDPSGATHWLECLRRKRIRAVIIPRPDVKVSAKAPIAGPPEELFREFFLLVTPDTAEQIAAGGAQTGK